MAEQIITPEMLKILADGFDNATYANPGDFRWMAANHLRAAADRIETLTRERDDLRKQVAAYELWKELSSTLEVKP